MKSDAKKLLDHHQALIHSENKKVVSHMQRDSDDWIINTLMIEGYDVPFRYKRKKLYKTLRGAYVNLTYYPVQEYVAGLEFEVMKVVRIRIA